MYILRITYIYNTSKSTTFLSLSLCLTHVYIYIFFYLFNDYLCVLCFSWFHVRVYAVRDAFPQAMVVRAGEHVV